MLELNHFLNKKTIASIIEDLLEYNPNNWTSLQLNLDTDQKLYGRRFKVTQLGTLYIHRGRRFLNSWSENRTTLIHAERKTELVH